MEQNSKTNAQLLEARKELEAARRENTLMLIYIATQGKCHDYSQWRANNNSTELTDVINLFSNVIEARDEMAEELLMEIETGKQRAATDTTEADTLND